VFDNLKYYHNVNEMVKEKLSKGIIAININAVYHIFDIFKFTNVIAHLYM